MVKRFESYQKQYELNVTGQPGGGISYSQDKEDNVIDELSKMCVQVKRKREGDLETAWFQWFTGGEMFNIEVFGSKDVLKDNYQRKIDVQIMPAKASLPQELSDLLNEKGYKKIT